MAMRNLIILLILLLLYACRDSEPTYLIYDHIENLCVSDPHRAIEILDSIPKMCLTGAGHHRCDLLSIKARDKAYIRHTSDSLILDVIDYYSRHTDKRLYAEALYYGARVYSDLGEDERALNFFHLAAYELDRSDADLALKSAVHSQYGRMLHKLRLDSLAVDQIREAIRLSSPLNDIVNEVHDLHLLGFAFLQMGNNDDALSVFSEAFQKSKSCTERLRKKSEVYLALAKIRIGDTESALKIIRGCTDNEDKIQDFSDSMLACAAQVYYNSGIFDTAYIFAKRLSENNDSPNMDIALQLLTSHELRGFSSADTLECYSEAYALLSENTLNGNKNTLALIQQATNMNNTIQKSFATKEGDHRGWGWCTLIIILLWGVSIWIRSRLKKYALHNSDSTHTSKADSTVYHSECRPEDDTLVTSENGLDNRIAKLRKTLLETAMNNSGEPYRVSQIIFDSQSYKRLLIIIQSKHFENLDKCFWKELEGAIIESSPDFRDNLFLLIGRSLSVEDYYTCLLIKCNISPINIALILNRKVNTIATRRRKLCELAYVDKIDLSTMDRIIQLL